VPERNWICIIDNVLDLYISKFNFVIIQVINVPIFFIFTFIIKVLLVMNSYKKLNKIPTLTMKNLSLEVIKDSYILKCR